MENFNIEVELLRSIFKCNNDPVNIIDQCIKKFLHKLYALKQIVPIVHKRELLFILPFLGTFSLNLRKCWYELISKSIWQLKLLFSPKINLAACLNSGIPFPYIFAPTLFTSFSVVSAILVTMAKMNVIYTFFLVCSICWEESTYETRENVFYFTLKALFFL